MSPSVVIVGGGFAGVSLAKVLDARKEVNVTLVSDRDFMYVKYGGLRAAAFGGAWVDRSQIALTDVVKRGKVVIGKLASVDSAGKAITLENGTKIAYDALVLATGSRARGVAEPASSASTRADFRGFFDKTRAALASAKSIAIVGGGPIGFEFAGEVRASVKRSTKVTLIAGKLGLLGAVNPPFKPALYVAAKKKLADNDVVLIEDSVSSPAIDPTAPFVHPEGGKVTLATGKVIDADVVFFCVGVEVRTSMLPTEWLDPATREVVVEPTFQVRGHTNVFAIGDIAKTGRTKLGYLATMDAAVAAANVLTVLKGGKPTKKYAPPAAMMIIPFGPRQGVSQLPWGVSGDYWTSLIKGKGLFENMMSKQLTGKPAVKADVPPAPA